MTTGQQRRTATIVPKNARAPIESKVAPAATVANDNLFHDFAGKYPAANRGVKLAETGIQELDRKRRLELFEQAKSEFETALSSLPVNKATIIPRRRLMINLAIVLRRLGRVEEAIAQLEFVRRTLAGDHDWALDGPRALDALGSNYLSVAPSRTQDAIIAYQQAQQILERGSQRRDPYRNQLLARVLSNLATAYIDQNNPTQALAVVNKSLSLQSRIKDQPVWGRTQRIKAEVLNLQAASFVEEGQFTQAHQSLTQAIATFEEARQSLRDFGALADWAEITGTLAGAESNLANLLANIRSKRELHDSLSYFRRAIPNYLEAFAALERQEDRSVIRENLGATLKSLLEYSTDFSDFFLVFSACREINNITGFEYDAFHRSILIDLARKFVKSVLSIGGLTKLEKVSVLADLLTSIGLTEGDAPAVLTAAFEQLRWSKLSISTSRSGPSLVGEAVLTPMPRPNHTEAFPQPPFASTPRKAALALPDKAPKLYEQRPKGQNIVDFLRDPDGWGPYVKAGILSRVDLRRLDPKAYKAVDNWLLHDPLPEDVRLLKKADVTDLIVTQHANAADLPAHILAALRSRQMRKKKLIND